MGHGLTATDRAVYGRGVSAWHGLGEVVPGMMTLPEAVGRVGSPLAFSVEMVELAVIGGSGQPVPARGLMRTDTGEVLAVHGARYSPLQNLDWAASVYAAIGDEARVDCLGTLFGGARVFATMRFEGDPDEGASIVGDDRLISYMLAFNAHDGTSTARLALSSVRTVCQNTVNAALNRATASVSVRHTGAVADRYARAASLVARARESRDEYVRVCRAMTGRSLDVNAQFAFVCEALGLDAEAEETRARNKLEVAREALRWERAHADSGSVRDTVWTAYNAVTNVANHGALVSRSKPGSEDRAASLLDGTAAQWNAAALAQAVALVA